MKTPLNNTSLLTNFINNHASDQVIYGQNQSLTKNDVVSRVHQIREQFPQLKNQVVALDISDPLLVVLMLCALDGFSHSIIIMPLDFTSLQKSQSTRKCNAGFQLTNINEQFFLDEFKTLPITNTLPVNTTWILATSGTTGEPKLIKHDFCSLTHKINFRYDCQQYTWGLLYSPYRFAGIQVILQSLISGNSLVIASGNDLTVNILAFRNAGVNALSATPSMWRNILMSEEAKNLALKVITLGGEIADQGILSQLQSTYVQASIRHIYASTEAGVGFSVSDLKAGFPLEWINNSTHLPALLINESHHLMVKIAQPNAFNSSVLLLDENGYYDTGDVVTIDNNRVLFIGRNNGVINIGGAKVYPEVVENIIRQHHNILSVCVYGQKNSILGQIVVADIVLKSSIENEKSFKQVLINHCKESLSKHQVPMLLYIKKTLNTNAANKLVRGNQ